MVRCIFVNVRRVAMNVLVSLSCHVLVCLSYAVGSNVNLRCRFRLLLSAQVHRPRHHHLHLPPFALALRLPIRCRFLSLRSNICVRNMPMHINECGQV